jgi:hypothetical protein
MTNEHPPGAGTAPSFIDGVHSYCDGWCERCRFQNRCRVYRTREQFRALALGQPHLENPEIEAPRPDTAASSEWRAFINEANQEPTPAELDQARKDHARLEAILDRDPVVLSAREYSEIVIGIGAGLDPLLEPGGDALIRAALDTIGRLGISIGVKVRRASRGRLREDEDDDEDFALEDANRTTKLVRLMIRESREAWAVLMQPGRAVGDGVPARMIARLDAIDAAMAARFPAAMDAIRPGLDE